MKATICFSLLIFLCSYSSLAQNNDDDEARLHIYRFLDDHKPINLYDMIDSNQATDVFKYYFHFDSIRNKENDIGLYFLSWNCSHACTEYIMAVDFLHKEYYVFGQHTLGKDLYDLKVFFNAHHAFKESTRIRCYEYLVDNGYEYYRAQHVTRH